jgi:hypothetical protein
MPFRTAKRPFRRASAIRRRPAIFPPSCIRTRTEPRPAYRAAGRIIQFPEIRTDDRCAGGAQASRDISLLQKNVVRGSELYALRRTERRSHSNSFAACRYSVGFQFFLFGVGARCPDMRADCVAFAPPQTSSPPCGTAQPRGVARHKSVASCNRKTSVCSEHSRSQPTLWTSYQEKCHEDCVVSCSRHCGRLSER